MNFYTAGNHEHSELFRPIDGSTKWGSEVMCGICGFVEPMGRVVDADMVLRMTQAMVHRGPDDEGFFLDGEVAMGFRRLSIVDLARGHQPMSNERETVWVVFNGEIYNHQELREQLVGRGHVFATQSDTEVLVHLYEEHGMELVHQLRGMFAFAIWDRERREMYLARDPFGIKPLYYTHTSSEFAFASEVRALRATGRVSAKLDAQSMWDYFTFQYVPDPQTMYSSIHKLPPGHYMRYKKGQIQITRYFRPSFLSDTEGGLEVHIERIQSALRESVRLHMSADVPYGAFLSSGVDSTAIVAMMREVDADVNTFSVGFDDEYGTRNELEAARATARQLQTRHHEVSISLPTFLESLPKMLVALDEPIADVSACALYFVAELAAREVKVVLSGEGADELFAGYPIYHEPNSLRVFEHLPPSVRMRIGKVARLLPDGMKGRSFLERGAVPLERRFVGNAKIFSEDAKSELFAKHSYVHSSFAVTDEVYQDQTSAGDITRMQLVDLQTWLPGDILMKADKMTMAHSLELRVPFLDKRVFAAATALPEHLRIHGQTTKYALREAVRPIVPEAAARRPKLGFPVPVSKWLEHSLKDHIRDVISASPVREYLNLRYVDELFVHHARGRQAAWRELWTVFTLAMWAMPSTESVGADQQRLSVRREA